MMEEKAVQVLIPSHELQWVNYLIATGTEIGLLPNFGPRRPEYQRKNQIYRANHTPKDPIL